MKTNTSNASAVPMVPDDQVEKESDFVCPKCGKTFYIVLGDREICDECLARGEEQDETEQ
jgi:hypothetical protein